MTGAANQTASERVVGVLAVSGRHGRSGDELYSWRLVGIVPGGMPTSRRDGGISYIENSLPNCGS